MCRSLLFGMGLSILVVLVSLPSFVHAKPKHGGQGHKARTTKTGTKQSADPQTVKALGSALKLLLSADHDYDGHRAKAADEVHQALMELHSQQGKTSSTSSAKVLAAVRQKALAEKKVANAGQPVAEDQATSDSQMRQAQEILQGASTRLSTMPTNAKTHSTAAKHAKTSNHPKAAAHVTAAIAEINTALAIK